MKWRSTHQKTPKTRPCIRIHLRLDAMGVAGGCCEQRVLVRQGDVGLRSGQEPGADPGSGGPQSEAGRDAAAVVDPASANHRGLAYVSVPAQW